MGCVRRHARRIGSGRAVGKSLYSCAYFRCTWNTPNRTSARHTWLWPPTRTASARNAPASTVRWTTWRSRKHMQVRCGGRERTPAASVILWAGTGETPRRRGSIEPSGSRPCGSRSAEGAGLSSIPVAPCRSFQGQVLPGTWLFAGGLVDAGGRSEGTRAQERRESRGTQHLWPEVRSAW